MVDKRKIVAIADLPERELLIKDAVDIAYVNGHSITLFDTPNQSAAFNQSNDICIYSLTPEMLKMEYQNIQESATLIVMPPIISEQILLKYNKFNTKILLKTNIDILY